MQFEQIVANANGCGYNAKLSILGVQQRKRKFLCTPSDTFVNRK